MFISTYVYALLASAAVVTSW